VADHIIHTDSLLKPLPEWQATLFEEEIYQRLLKQQLSSRDNSVVTKRNYKSMRVPKEDYILYPATVATQKGQLEFAMALDPTILTRRNLTIVFAGAQVSEYAEQVWSVLKQKGVSFEYKGFILDRKELATLYVGARGVILFSRSDPGPRVIYEALYGGCPYLIGEGVELDTRLDSFGMRLESPFMEDLNEKLEVFLSRDWGTASVDFARDELNEDRVMSKLFEKIDGIFCSTFPERCSLRRKKSLEERSTLK